MSHYANGLFVNNTIHGTIIPNANSPFTWVPVICGGDAVGEGQCKALKFWNDDVGLNTGYAIYKTEDWTNRPDKTAEADLLSITAPEPFLFLPSAGERESEGTVWRVGGEGSYWSSSITGTHGSSCTGFDKGAVSARGDSDRMGGMSVRCVAEN